MNGNIIIVIILTTLLTLYLYKLNCSECIPHPVPAPL